jgi:hypothetical protein
VVSGLFLESNACWRSGAGTDLAFVALGLLRVLLSNASPFAIARGEVPLAMGLREVMSDDDKHVIIGRLVPEYERIRVEREFLKAKAHTPGSEMSKLGSLVEKYSLNEASSHLRYVEYKVSRA